MMSDTIIETNSILDDSEIGKKFIFWYPNMPDGIPFGFASKLENIGIIEKHDCELKNKTEVIAISDPTEANHATRGPILVTKVLAHTIMWVPTLSLHFVDDK